MPAPVPAPAGTAGSVCSAFTPALGFVPSSLRGCPGIHGRGAAHDERHLVNRKPTPPSAALPGENNRKYQHSPGHARLGVRPGLPGSRFHSGALRGPFTLPRRAGTHPGLPTAACRGLMSFCSIVFKILTAIPVRRDEDGIICSPLHLHTASSSFSARSSEHTQISARAQGHPGNEKFHFLGAPERPKAPLPVLAVTAQPQHCRAPRDRAAAWAGRGCWG